MPFAVMTTRLNKYYYYYFNILYPSIYTADEQRTLRQDDTEASCDEMTEATAAAAACQ